MNITIMIGGLSGGGAERVVCNLGNFLCKNHKVTILTMSEDEAAYGLSDKIRRISLIHKSETNSKVVNNIKRLLRLRKFIKKYESDLYIVFLPVTTTLLLLNRKLIKVPIIVSERGDPKQRYNMSLINRFIMKKIYPKADYFVYQTQDSQEFYQSLFNKEGIVIPNAINEEFIAPKVIKKRSMTIISIGRFTKQKNFKMLIDAFGTISKKYPEYKLYIYGEGPLRANLENQIESMGLTNKVILPGYIKNIRKKLEEASLFVLSSNYEGMPNALMEAMALGVPSISTDCPVGGPRYLIEDGVNGFLVPIGDKKLLAHKMDQILSDEMLKNNLSSASKEIISKLHPDKIYRTWENLVEDIYKAKKYH